MGQPISIEARISFLCSRNQDGSYGTQAERLKKLQKFGRGLKEEFRLKNLNNLKKKHVTTMVQKWIQDPKISVETMKNYMTHVRWLAEKLGKSGMIPRSNAALGIPERKVDYNTDRAWAPSQELKNDLPERQAIMVDLMHSFGMRFREAAMFRPIEDNKGDRLFITNGPKNGRERFIPVRTEEQREVLSRVADFVQRNGTHNIMPQDKSYKTFQASTNNAFRQVGMIRQEAGGLGTAHGLRHEYAQVRFEELTGFKAPCRMTQEERQDFVASLTREQREMINEAKLELSEELGHGRSHVCHRYIGSFAD